MKQTKMRQLIIVIALTLSACAREGHGLKDSVFDVWTGPEIGRVDLSSAYYGSQKAMINRCFCGVGIEGQANSGRLSIYKCVPEGADSDAVREFECAELNKDYLYSVRASTLELCELDQPTNCQLYY